MTDTRCTCESCGAVIWDHEPKFKENGNTFCSLECRDTYASENRPRPTFHPELELDDRPRQLILAL